MPALPHSLLPNPVQVCAQLLPQRAQTHQQGPWASTPGTGSWCHHPSPHSMAGQQSQQCWQTPVVQLLTRGRNILLHCIPNSFDQWSTHRWLIIEPWHSIFKWNAELDTSNTLIMALQSSRLRRIILHYSLAASDIQESTLLTEEWLCFPGFLPFSFYQRFTKFYA